MTTLGVSDFEAWFLAIHGHAPYPWQSRLLRQVAEQGWPDVLSLPTGAGKTAVLDIALFALALRPQTHPRRIVLVIDRRVVVDQARERADRLRAAHRSPSSVAVAAVAASLRSLWGAAADAMPFECATLRGAMPRDDTWARRPDRPVLAVSTVDQVGSGLLFRGYGVSSRMSSINAGLLGHDTLFLLDEVHLSEPFAQTLLAVGERWREFHGAALPGRWGVVRMSATPGASRTGERRFGTADAKWSEDRAHPALRRRLMAAKPARLRRVQASGKDEASRVRALADAAAHEAERLVRSGAIRIAVVLNRVAGARAAAQQLRRALADKADVALLTGRMRPLDRDAVLAEVLPRIEAGGDDPDGAQAKPLVVVATQCIEAGADFDFDALVTECAAIDALRQRFGRLNRSGTLACHGAVILARQDQVGDKAEPDAVYGTALRQTWMHLGGDGAGVDFGIEAMDQRLEGTDTAPFLSPREVAPLLLPMHLDLLSQTHPRPDPDPEIAPWLHGPARGQPDVQIVWRADLDMDALAPDGGNAFEVALDRLASCPPTSLEAISVPISAARRWLRGEAEGVLTDVAAVDDEEPRGEPKERMRHAIAWLGDDSRVVDAGGLKPGMTLIVPSAYGGIDCANWDPAAVAAVVDVAELALWHARSQPVFRLDPRCSPLAADAPGIDDEATSAERRTAYARWLRDNAASWPAPWGDIGRALARRLRVVRHRDGSVTLTGPRVNSASTEDDSASFTAAAVSLARHSEEVRTWAARFVARLGLPAAVAEAIVLAAWLHDVGKSDPRFQRWLVGGSEFRLAAMAEPLAKSAQTAADRAASELARRRAGYPEGCRHELLSVAMVAAHPELLSRASDPDLVLHLVGSHHGWCRPFAPALDDEDIEAAFSLPDGDRGGLVLLRASTRHGLARLDSGVADRFWRLTERYGWWGLAWLEAILRLADHRASEHAAADVNGAPDASA